jgi:hypothetical protein
MGGLLWITNWKEYGKKPSLSCFKITILHKNYGKSVIRTEIRTQGISRNYITTQCKPYVIHVSLSRCHFFVY